MAKESSSARKASPVEDAVERARWNGTLALLADQIQRGRRQPDRPVARWKVVVRRDDQGRWSNRLGGDLSKIVGVDGRYCAVTDAAFSTWIDEPEPSEIAETEPVIQGNSHWCPRGDSNTRHAV